MNGHALMFGALWIGTASICICQQNASKVTDFDYAEGPESLMNSAVGLGHQVFQGEGAAFRITILVYNYAGVPADTLTRAEDVAARIFRHAEIETVWRDCHADDFEPKLGPCPSPSASAPALRIQSQFRHVPDLVHANAMGFSVGYWAAVCVECADKLARGGMGAVYVILGHIAAHEVGHILLPGNAHTASGIMKAKWSLNDWTQAGHGALFFTPQQAEFLRGELRVRWEQ